MDIGGINRIKPGLKALAAGFRKNVGADPDRDAQRGGYEKQKKAIHLTPEQEQEAINALNRLPAFLKAGLVAVLVRAEGEAPHVEVRDGTGTIVRHMPYDDLVDLYLNRHSGNQKGQLINKAA